ncbi:MAG: hypothetical protein GY725_17720 [bacterium]|nr:hypothetical protein [bacterium]
MRRVAKFSLLICIMAFAVNPAFSQEPKSDKGRVWQINGIRLEQDQIERLALDMAERTVKAVEEKVEGIALEDSQRSAMRKAYRKVSLDVYDEVVRVVSEEATSNAQKETRVRELILAGQKRSHALLVEVLDDRQMRLYSKWEDQQVEAFQSKRWENRRRRRRR